jgi:hypothetical protein
MNNIVIRFLRLILVAVEDLPVTNILALRHTLAILVDLLILALLLMRTVHVIISNRMEIMIDTIQAVALNAVAITHSSIVQCLDPVPDKVYVNSSGAPNHIDRTRGIPRMLMENMLNEDHACIHQVLRPELRTMERCWEIWIPITTKKLARMKCWHSIKN